jgi:hypothetical protein
MRETQVAFDIEYAERIIKASADVALKRMRKLTRNSREPNERRRYTYQSPGWQKPKRSTSLR